MLRLRRYWIPKGYAAGPAGTQDLSAALQLASRQGSGEGLATLERREQQTTMLNRECLAPDLSGIGDILQFFGQKVRNAFSFWFDGSLARLKS